MLYERAPMVFFFSVSEIVVCFVSRWMAVVWFVSEWIALLHTWCCSVIIISMCVMHSRDKSFACHLLSVCIKNTHVHAHHLAMRVQKYL
jgi:hypothetical protein